ncbi:hypothetical protein [Caulobacter soli]|uniref:hypothetical protein n=1 Tax=Caulobacter soli TaxID=2708539 RepID=UPI0013EDBFAD|nr:hypothetical protein [Caulobacter soli]
MRFVHPGGPTDWGLLEDGAVRHLAGTLPAWAPRVAYGEGRAALPLNGRVEPEKPTAPLSIGRHFRRSFHDPDLEGQGLLAAVIGAAPLGADRPFRCVLGYVAAALDRGGRLTLGPVLVTADEFGAAGPPLAPQPGGSSLSDRIRAYDQHHALRTGDLLIVAHARLTDAMSTRLRNQAAGQIDRQLADASSLRALQPS